jgi:very-short-patch-repair endonuclease
VQSRNVVIGQVVGREGVEATRRLRRTMTRAERILWQALRRNQVAGSHFRRQQLIDGYIADFYCHRAGLVIEVDGASHLGREDYDKARDEAFAARGLRVLRISNARVESDLEAVLEEIRTSLTATPPSRAGKGDGGLGPAPRFGPSPASEGVDSA